MSVEQQDIDFVQYTFEYTTLEVEENQFWSRLSEFGVNVSDEDALLPAGIYVIVAGKPRILERFR